MNDTNTIWLFVGWVVGFLACLGIVYLTLTFIGVRVKLERDQNFSYTLRSPFTKPFTHNPPKTKPRDSEPWMGVIKDFEDDERLDREAEENQA
jgi:hypothetical protein